MSGLDQYPTQSKPPPAPPLPPQARYGHRAATAFARFAHPFFAGSRLDAQKDNGRVKANTSQYDGVHGAQSTTRKEAVHKTGLAISAIDISPYRTHAVLAGREILRTIRVDASSCTAEFDLRSGIISYSSAHENNKDTITAGQKEQLAAVDVKWSHGTFDTTIATAASNGKIVIFDLNKPSIEVARLQEHNRQVHKIAFNPHQPALILSGSQDGSVRLWDLRNLGSEGGRSMRVLSSIKRYPANSEGVRDVKWAPHDGLIFAIGTENGSVQKWDLRKENAPSLRLHGHDRSCSAIDWHPGGRYLASGSWEKLVKIWDFALEDRRMKPINQIRTPQAVNHMTWRPNTLSGSGTFVDSSNMTTQITTSYDGKDPRIHVWDLRRPNVPILEVEKYDTSATGLVWHSRDLLWSVGQTGTFTQNDMSSAFQPIRRHGSALAITSDGRVAFFSSKKARFGLIAESLAGEVDQKSPYSEQAPDHVNNIKDISPEEQIMENTIQRRRQKTAEVRSNNSFSSNTADDMDEKLQILKAQLLSTFTSPQLAAIGHISGVCDVDAFTYLAETYETPSCDFLAYRMANPHVCIQESFEKNARCAEAVDDHRLAQTWRVLAYLTGNELRRRITSNAVQPPKSSGKNKPEVLKHSNDRTSEIKPTMSKPVSSIPRADDSALSTPIARPSQDTNMLHEIPSENLDLSYKSGSSGSSSTDFRSHSPLDHTNSSAHFDGKANGLSSEDAAENSVSKRPTAATAIPELQLPFSSFPGLEEHLEESRNALNNYRVKPRAIINLDGPFGTMQETSYMAPLDRHDSNESFQMFSASADSDPRSFSLEDSFDERKSFSQISNGSFASLQPSFSRARLDDLKEDDGQSTPLVIEPQELAEEHNLPVIEKISTQVTNDLMKKEPIRRPSVSHQVKIHKEEVLNHLEDGQSTAPTSASAHIYNHEPPVDSKPWTVYSVIRPLMGHHVGPLCDSQFPTFLAIWLWQFFPTEFNRAQITALALFYHKRLLSLQLYEPAARLRRCCAILFPEILDYTPSITAAHLLCRACNQAFVSKKPSTPAHIDPSICTSCKEAPASCSICESYTPPTFGPQLPSAPLLWTWCQGCGHGGHASCLSTWFSNPSIAEGACPILGCNHDCVPGIRREQVIADLEQQRKRFRKSVIRDDWTVGESKAVERARDIVAPMESASSRRGSKTVATSSANAHPIATNRRVRLLLDDQGGAAPARAE